MNNAFVTECHVCMISGKDDNKVTFHGPDIGFANLGTDFTVGGRLTFSLTYEAA